MSDISCRLFEFFENGAELYGYSLEELTADLGYELEYLRDPSHRVPWRIWATLSERFEELIGGEEETIRAGQRIISMKLAEPVRIMGGALASPELIYRAIASWLAPVYFRSLEWRIEELGPGHLIIEIEVPDPVSPAWFRMATGAFRDVPKAVNSEIALVNPSVQGNCGRFEIRCAARTTWWARIAARWRAAMSAGALLDEMITLQRDLRNALGDATNSQHELRRALSAVPDPVVIVRESEILWRNEAWSTTLDDQVPEQVSSALQHSKQVDTLVVHTDSNLILQVVPPVSIMHDGRPALLVLLRDVTETHQAAERMRVADRLASLGTLAASVGHEINNPLQVAMGSLELAIHSLDGQADHTSKRQLEAAITAIERAATITSDLLAVGRDDSIRETVDIAVVLDTALRLTGNELRHIGKIEQDIPAELPTVTGASSSLIQVFVNLLVNAAHAMQSQTGKEHTIKIAARVEQDQVWIVIEDSGPGIAPDLLLRIREPFFTTKGNQGSGLGLAICERILKDHGGSLDIENRPQGGARFSVHLPIGQAPAGNGATPDQAAPGIDGSLRILIVDDEQAIPHLLALLLEQHTVIPCHNGDEALRAVADNPAFDVVLLDIMLKEQDGIALLKQLPSALQERVIFMTGGVFREDLQEQLALLSNPILAKPFNRESVLDCIATVKLAHR